MNLQLNPKLQPPRNETTEHFFLKQVSLAILRINMRCECVGNEVVLFEDDCQRSGDFYKFYHETPRSISDAVGIKFMRDFKTNEISTVTRSIEAKVSLSDLRSGYCIGADYNYVISPKGLISPEKLFPGVGLIEVDFQKVYFGVYKEKYAIDGVSVIKKAGRVIRKYRPEYHNMLVLREVCRSNADELTKKGKYFYPGCRINE